MAARSFLITSAAPRRREGTTLVVASLLAGAVALATSAPAACAQDTATTVSRAFGADQFVAGASPRVVEAVPGDLIAAGGTVEVDAPVAGDAVVAGGNVQLRGSVGQSVYAAAGRLSITGPVGRNVRIAGGRVGIGEKAAIDGNVSVAGGDVRIEGSVKGYVQASGGWVRIDGPVAGDVVATTGHLELGPKARIGGRLRYASGEEVSRDPAATVAGGIERMDMQGGWPVPDTAERSIGRAGGWLWSLGLIGLAIVLVALLPRFYLRVAATVRARPWWSLLVGFIVLVCTPAAALLMVATLVGVPLGLLTLLLYFALLLVGYVSAGIVVGSLLLARFREDAVTTTGWRVAAAMLGVLLVAIVTRVPFVGGWIVLAAMLIGVGALALQLRPGDVPRAAQRTGSGR